ncbi:hypothetical protein QM334_36575, partial [Burkholderia cenocepacia]|nr:hypothetical protein [Burkholderia cenocepacia]
ALLAARADMASDLAQQLGCAFDDGPLGTAIRVDTWKRTSVAGVYAAGDARPLPRVDANRGAERPVVER